jgi:hypothetical protein
MEKVMEKRTFTEIEKDFTAHLSSAKLSKDQLADVSKAIAKSYGAGFRFIDWHIKGQPPFEQFIAHAQLPISASAEINSLLVTNAIKEIRILKKGIPKPDFFDVNIIIEKYQ